MKNEKSKKKIQWFLFPGPQHGALWGGDGIVSHPRFCERGATREVMRGGVVEKDLEITALVRRCDLHRSSTINK